MKILPFKIPKPQPDALILQEDLEDVFYDKLHQHQEIQISLILSGTGTLLVGDTVNRFNPNDIVVLGTNLPHVFKSDLSMDQKSHMLTVFFDQNTFGKGFFEIEELKTLQNFFSFSRSGFKVIEPTEDLKFLFLKMKNVSKLERFVLFFDLLQKLHKSKKTRLSSFLSNKRYSNTEGNRMSTIFDYTVNHFQEEITLSQIAKEAALTKTAFCRFFKARTNKTYQQFLKELRLEHACQLLQSEKSQKLIADIAFECGFNSVSNFNRYFKKEKGVSPLQYRQGF